MSRLAYFNDIVNLFWICFFSIHCGLFLLCCFADGFITFIKTELGDAITIMVCFAFFVEILITLTRIVLL